MNDAQARLAERLAPDLEQVLGTAIQIDELDDRGRGPRHGARCVCLIEGRSRQIEARGETAIEAITEDDPSWPRKRGWRRHSGQLLTELVGPSTSSGTAGALLGINCGPFRAPTTPYTQSAGA